MSNLTPLTNYLCGAIDLVAENIEALSEQIDSASNLLLQCLLNDGKILVCGNAFAAPIAQLLTTSLMHQHEFERPGLPAINIATDSTTLSAISADSHNNQVFSKQLKAVGREGDCLIALSVDGNCSSIIQAIKTAQEKGISVLVITGFEKGELSGMSQLDNEIALHASSLSTALELMLLASNGLCRSLESKLFGVPLD